MPRRLFMGSMALAIGLTTHVHVALAAESSSAKTQSASDKIPLHLPASGDDKSSSLAGSSGSGLMRTVIGLVIVILVIWGISKMLRFFKASKENKASGNSLQNVATLPLGNNRNIHVVRVGSEIMLLGTAEQQVTQLARYSEEEAYERGLLSSEPAPRKMLGAGGLLKTSRSSEVVDVTPRDHSTVAVTRNGAPVNANGSQGNGTFAQNFVEQLRARTVRK